MGLRARAFRSFGARRHRQRGRRAVVVAHVPQALSTAATTRFRRGRHVLYLKHAMKLCELQYRIITDIAADRAGRQNDEKERIYYFDGQFVLSKSRANILKTRWIPAHTCVSVKSCSLLVTAIRMYQIFKTLYPKIPKKCVHVLYILLEFGRVEHAALKLFFFSPARRHQGYWTIPCQQ